MITSTTQLVDDAYRAYLPKVRAYILYKTNDEELSHDLAQDIFIRLLEYERMLCVETIESMIFTITRNIVIDYARRQYRRQEISEQIMREIENESPYNVEHDVMNRDIIEHAQRRLALMPRQRRTIYIMKYFEDKSAKEISEMLNLSTRTVENHLFIGNKEMRSYIKNCI